MAQPPVNNALAEEEVVVWKIIISEVIISATRSLTAVSVRTAASTLRGRYVSSSSPAVLLSQCCMDSGKHVIHHYFLQAFLHFLV